jgi:hypothetical protein
MRQVRFLLASALTLAFSFPFLATIWYRGDPLILANETVAYRFFFAERLLHGEGASIWVLAGFLTTAVQTAWLAVINLFCAPSPETLSLRLHLFAYGFSFFVAAAGGAIFFRAAANRRLAFAELLLLSIPALGPAYLTRIIGFYYYYLPDYYHLNVLLTVAAVWIFLLLWTDARSSARPLRQVFFLGLFVGLMGGNKITMFVIGAPLLAFAGLESPLSWARLAVRTLLGALGVALGFLFVIWWFYLFKFSAVREMFSAWSATVRNPGGEVDFWTVEFRNYLTSYSYGYIIFIYLLIIFTTAFLAFRDMTRRSLAVSLVGLLFVGGVAWCYFVFKRPAGSTLFEGSVALLGLSAMALAICARQRAGRWLIAAILVASTGYAVDTFAWNRSLKTLRSSRSWGQIMWRLQSELLSFANGRKIVVILPNNDHTYYGVTELLLKGGSDMPTWKISEHGRPFIERYAPHMSFRSEAGGVPPNDPYSDDSILFWVDLPRFPPLTEAYPRLRVASERPNGQHKEWILPIEGTLKAHAVALPKQPLEMAAQVVENPPDEFNAERTSHNSVKLTWDADGVAEVEIEIRAKGGDWQPFGWANAATNQIVEDGLPPGRDYLFRMRKQFANRHSNWTEAQELAGSAQSTGSASP